MNGNMGVNARALCRRQNRPCVIMAKWKFRRSRLCELSVTGYPPNFGFRSHFTSASYALPSITRDPRMMKQSLDCNAHSNDVDHGHGHKPWPLHNHKPRASPPHKKYGPGRQPGPKRFWKHSGKAPECHRLYTTAVRRLAIAVLLPSTAIPTSSLPQAR